MDQAIASDIAEGERETDEDNEE